MVAAVLADLIFQEVIIVYIYLSCLVLSLETFLSHTYIRAA